MDVTVIIGIVIVVLVLAGLAISVPMLISEYREGANSNPSSNNSVIASFTFTESEWADVFRQEFVGDEKGKSFFARFSAVIQRSENSNEPANGKIIFSLATIFLTDERNAKLFRVNQLNGFGRGIHLISADLLNFSPQKKLRIKVRVDSVNDNLNPVDFDLEYLVPIPQSADTDINDVLRQYGNLVLSAKN